jgi:formylglycine-generating enzyme required for sulfatase activity
MGSAYGEEDEGPVHTVTLDDYYIGQTEVTQAQWRAVMGAVPAYFAGCDECPVERVSWDEIQIFLGRLNNLSGAILYRLPTEAEWEYAARGGNRSRGYVFSGGNDIDSVGWHALNSKGRTHVVKGKMPNELGLYDMTGNVWEWCVEWYKSYSEGVTAGTSRYRVNRGGSWQLTPRQSRVTYRDGIAPHEKSYMLGFRVVRDIPLTR